MKIVFDNEWEKTRLLTGWCPSDIGLNDAVDCEQGDADIDICTKCWEAATTLEVAEERRSKMLRIMYEQETIKDYVTPINVASALIESKVFEPVELEEIAEHLLTYVKRIRIEAKLAGVDI